MENKKGFTLVELLAVIVVLAIILAIAIPSISGVIKNSTKATFKSDAKMVLKAIDYKKIENDAFNPLEITKENMTETLGLSGDNYLQVSLSINEDEIFAVFVGQNKWEGFTAYGTYRTLKVVETNGFDIIPPAITIIGDNPVSIGIGDTYVDLGATAHDLEDGDVPLTSTVIKNANNETVESIDTSSYGTYTIVYTAQDSVGNIASSVRRVNIIDKNAPVITILGDNPVNMSLGESYIDAGATATDNNDGDVTSSIVTTGNVFPNLIGIYTITYTVTDSFGNEGMAVRTINVNSPVIQDFIYTGAVQTFTIPATSIYKIELWGAKGGGTNGGNGGYVTGELSLAKDQIINIYVGGTTSTPIGGWNGGANAQNDQGNNSGGGGGGTDIRIGGTDPKDRIMVASGGGGGSKDSTYAGGAGGGLTGYNGVGKTTGTFHGAGGTQTAGGSGGPTGLAGTKGSFFSGGYAIWGSGAGGGGYYGGGGGSYNNDGYPGGGGGGGSSFISGHTGCDAINSAGSHTGQSNHYSGNVFTNTEMIDGANSMPNPSGGTEIGHTGNGYARITQLGAANEKPNITVLGEDPVIIYQGATYIDAGATATDDKDGDITNKIVTTSNINTNLSDTYEVTYRVTDTDGITTTAVRTVKVFPSQINFAYLGVAQTYVTLMEGTYKFELWGAKGGGTNGGNGGYVTGKLNLVRDQTINIYVGGTTSTSIGGWNGGANAQNDQSNNSGGGGGGTDIRIGGIDPKDRIMVASGGGGRSKDSTYAGGAGGGLTGYNGVGKITGTFHGAGGTQTAGGSGGTVGLAGTAGSFFSGGYAIWGSGAGGGGYYGGGGGSYNNDGNPGGGGGGGSSFISGHTGCDAINSAGSHTGQSNHYSGNVFTNTEMIDGANSMPNPSGGTEIGHTGNGYARITYLPES